jgi:hypothetical protein
MRCEGRCSDGKKKREKMKKDVLSWCKESTGTAWQAGSQSECTIWQPIKIKNFFRVVSSFSIHFDQPPRRRA